MSIHLTHLHIQQQEQWMIEKETNQKLLLFAVSTAFHFVIENFV
jgi:hypothetical protein